jgi:gliding motility-associated-like protein
MTRNIYVIDIKANAGKDSTFCTGTITNFKIGDSSAIAGYMYSWTPITGLNNANIASPTVNISQNTQYELSIYDPYTGCIALDTIFLGINNNLDTFKYIDTLCDGDTKVFFGQNITISGIYQHYVKDKLNCDKEVHILSIFFRKPSLSNSIQKACNFYIDKNGVKHTDSFEYKDSTYINGCLANIHTTKIKILKTRYEDIDMTGCYKMNWKGKTYLDTIKKIDSFTFKDNGCDTLIQYVNLNVVKKSDIKIISTHANPLNFGEEIVLQAFGSNNYKWNTGDIGFQLNHTATKDYQFYVVGYNNVLCPDTAYYNIVLSSQSAIELPEIFSPNDDGKNDLFKPNYKGNAKLLDLIIFNRWGEKMYEGHGNEAYWNGKYKGEYQSSGTYIYLFRYIINGKEESKKGSFVLVR